MVYGLLPNKTEATYRKIFKMIKSAIKIYPTAIHMDFEKAVMNAEVFFFKCKIWGCLFTFLKILFNPASTIRVLKKKVKMQK
jgi:hypothetical protein